MDDVNLLSLGPDTNNANDFELLMHDACMNNDKSSAQDILFLSNDSQKHQQILDNGLRGACIGGHVELTKFLIKKGASSLTSGVYCACSGGHLGLVKYMVSELSAKQPFYSWDYVWNMALRCACVGGNQNVIDYVIEKYAFFNVKIEWEKGLAGACEGGHLDLAKNMILRGAGRYHWDTALWHACRKKHTALAKYLLNSDGNKPGMNFCEYEFTEEILIFMLENEILVPKYSLHELNNLRLNALALKIEIFRNIVVSLSNVLLPLLPELLRIVSSYSLF